MPLFGEIVEPVSRALYSDGSSDEEDNESSDEKIKNVVQIGKIQWEDEIPETIDTLVVFHGQLASDFLLKILQDINSKSFVHFRDRYLNGMKASKEQNIFMCKLSSGVFGCLCPSSDIKVSNNILEKLVPVLKTCKHVVVILTVPAPFYKGNDPTLDLPPSFLRMLYTSIFESKNIIAPLLETPNLIAGVPAAVLNWCEISKKSACLYVCYSDSNHLDSISAEPLMNIFANVFEGLFESKVFLFQSAVQEPSSNMYM